MPTYTKGDRLWFMTASGYSKSDAVYFVKELNDHNYVVENKEGMHLYVGKDQVYMEENDLVLSRLKD